MLQPWHVDHTARTEEQEGLGEAGWTRKVFRVGVNLHNVGRICRNYSADRAEPYCKYSSMLRVYLMQALCEDSRVAEDLAERRCAAKLREERWTGDCRSILESAD